MRIQGRDCTLTVSRDGEFTPLPYSEETVRLTSKGYVLPECIGKRNREKTVITHKEIEGCFITRLDYSVIQCLFLLFFYDNENFDLYADRGFEKIIYRNVSFKAFELRGVNGEAFKLRVDVKSSEESFTENWPINVPDLSWQKQNTIPSPRSFHQIMTKTLYIENPLYFLYNNKIMSRCFTMLKPGVVNRRLVGEVIERLEKKGFKLVGMKMMHVTEELAGKHYAEHDGKPFYNDLVDYVTSGPVIAMVWQADDCVTLMRKVVGATKPTEAVPGTIRGDYCIHTDRNIIHASDSDESAEREINLWFKPEEIYDWKDCEDGWF